jgi:cell division protein FtsL
MDWISHCVRQSRWKLGGKSVGGVLLILLALSLLGWIYLTQASYVATTSRRIQDLEAQKLRLRQENLQLMAEIAELESVTQLATRAQELGFTTCYVEDSEFLVVADLPRVQEHSPQDDSPMARWWGDVAAQFTAWTQVESR